MAAIEQTYHYAAPSTLAPGPSGPALSLVCNTQAEASQRFLMARALAPDITAKGLRAVSEIVGSRFYVPPSMLVRVLREADPVATVSPSAVRFEGFSACCSVYARIDLDDGALAISHRRNGTTNVDFGPELRAALANVGQDSTLEIGIGADAVDVTRDGTQVIERKVPLPLRWLKGLAQVQVVLAAMQPAFELSRLGAQRFLRALPRSQADHLQWVSAAHGVARLSPRKGPGAVPLRGAHRLRALEPLLLRADALNVFHDATTDATAWLLHCGAHRLTFVLNAEPWRGFSGDGGALSALATADSAVTARLRAWLNWQDRIDTASLAAATRLSTDAVRSGLGTLAASGLVGYDLHTQSYFHRVLPFDTDQIEAMNPRLAAAQDLVATSVITVTGTHARVKSGDVVHHVTLASEGATCTCPWFAKNGHQRGPCKHVLAVQILQGHRA